MLLKKVSAPGLKVDERLLDKIKKAKPTMEIASYVPWFEQTEKILE